MKRLRWQKVPFILLVFTSNTQVQLALICVYFLLKYLLLRQLEKYHTIDY